MQIIQDEQFAQNRQNLAFIEAAKSSHTVAGRASQTTTLFGSILNPVTVSSSQNS